MSSMQGKAATIIFLMGSGVAAGAVLAQVPLVSAPQPYVPTLPATQYAAPRPYYSAPYQANPRIAAALGQWYSLRQTDNLPFSSYASFLLSYRGWPGETGMRKSAERAISPDITSPTEVVSFFQALPPLTATGEARYAFALLALGRVDEARQAARRAWWGGTLPIADESRLLAQFGAALTPADHDRRLEKLLAAGDIAGAQRVLVYASPARRPVYQARIALQTRAADADAQVSALGAAADSDAGMLMDRANWYRDTAQSVSARALLARPHNLAAPPADPDKWLDTLLVMAKGAAADRNWMTAWQIASQLGDAFPVGADVSAQSAGARDDYTSLAWLAGTIALQKLGRPADAVALFELYAGAARSAQTQSKGFYWAGRAAAAAGQSARADAYFAQAARPDVFYGQLALERLGRPIDPPASAEQATAAVPAAGDLAEATRLAGLTRGWADQSLFVRALADRVASDEDRRAADRLGRRIGRPDLGVWVGRSARNSGASFYARDSYPEVRLPPAYQSNWALAHAIIRQESSFDRAAVSPAGARGMMQVMVPTARQLAGKIGLPFDSGRLVSDADYNILLGSTHLADLVNLWGSYPLAVAAYNAGSGNVAKWIAAYGDPRMPGVDMIDWIEAIPFQETRNYVQRVLENAVVYDTFNPARNRMLASNPLSFYLGKSSRPG